MAARQHPAILSEKKGNYFDRFRQRLMIPIFSLSKKPIGFGGRTLKKGEPAKKFGEPFGSAIKEIETGEHVHVHNVISNIGKTE